MRFGPCNLKITRSARFQQAMILLVEMADLDKQFAYGLRIQKYKNAYGRIRDFFLKSTLCKTFVNG